MLDVPTPLRSLGFLLLTIPTAFSADTSVLKPAAFAHHVERFNTMEDENITNFVSNAKSWDWLQKNIPLFECPDREVEEMYYFRWWTYRKHLVKTPNGFVVTEFLTPVRHAGTNNTVSCAAGFHIAEGRWLRDEKYVDDYIRFWLRGDKGKPQPHFHKYSSWFASAVYDAYLVNLDKKFVTDLLPDLVADYKLWEQERQLPNGLFWQYDVRDGMEESISGSRTNKNVRPTINSYMVANASAISQIAGLAKRDSLIHEWHDRSWNLRLRMIATLWDERAQFYKVWIENRGLSDAREEIGFVPWMFNDTAVLSNETWTEPKISSQTAWEQFNDPQGFHAPFGITTAERRHPQFRSHGVGTCEWDGAVWPFATCQTLYALANVLRDKQGAVTSRDYFDAFHTYVHSQHANGKPYIGEYLDEVTGDWINGRNGRSRYYNHSTFADLLITGVVGLRPRADDTVEVFPLLPANTWDWFCLDGVKYHGRMLTILWDKDGSRYHQGPGLRVWADGKQIARSDKLERLTGTLP
jgi:mannosylglycerate hydrolase MGH1-like protein/glycosyl hydrolase family 65